MNAPLPFQDFQFALARHLRHPHRVPRPVGVSARRTEIYHGLVRNNFEGFLLACFPMTHTLLGARRWSRLVDTFFREARCHTPYFREIPCEFLHWLLASPALPISFPAWLPELAHYEWVELAVDVMETSSPFAYHPTGNLLDGQPVLPPAAMNLAYAWPVHRISPAWRPRKPSATHLLVFRDVYEAVQFIVLNPVSARLVVLLQAAEGELSGRDACLQIAHELQHPEPELLLMHGAHLLDQLRIAGAILGSKK
ncbi:MAG TPA: putative DNA-binding domain-containing protein [Rugosibacter sp.]